MRRRDQVLVLAIAVLSLASGVQAQTSKPVGRTQVPSGFSPGWYIVQPGAEFSVLQMASSEMVADSAGKTPDPASVTIRAGEVVLAFEHARGTHLVFEWFGRMSAVRGTGGLVKAPPPGRPGLLREDVQLLDGTLTAGSAYWIMSIDAGAGTATVLLDGGKTQTIPNKSIEVVMNGYGAVLKRATYRQVD